MVLRDSYSRHKQSPACFKVSPSTLCKTELTVCSEKKLWGVEITETPPEVPFESVVEAKDLKGLADLTDKLVSFTSPLVVTPG